MQHNVIRFLAAVAAAVFTLGVYHQLGQNGSDKDMASWSIFPTVGRDNVVFKLQQSEEIYQRTLSGRRWLLSQYGIDSQHVLFPAIDAYSYFKTPFTIWDFLPASFNCPHSVQRIGRFGDGGKWLCGLEKLEALPHSRKVQQNAAFDSAVATEMRQILKTSGKESVPGKQPGCIIYSMGIQNESSFEVEMLDRAPSCEIWGYDFSVSEFGPQLDTVKTEGRAHFTTVGIGSATVLTKIPAFVTIQDLMYMNKHDHIDVLKIDIEGYEFSALSSLLKHYALLEQPIPISQILIEIHLMPDKFQTVDGVITWWETLEAVGFRPVWTEPNLLSTTMPMHDRMTRYAEYTFLNTRDPQSPFLKS